MPILLFTVGPQAVGQIHDMLACLGKFNEDISIEATQSELRLSSLNVSKTAHAAYSLTANTFFEKYHFSPDQRGSAEPKIWACKLQNRALASVFRRRLSDSRDKDTGLEKCEFELQARADSPECRILVRLICHLGVTKTYRLTYETGEILHASFDRTGSTNLWTVSSRTLRDVVEYFGPKTEQLDWYLQDSQVTFTSYTEKIQNGREILKQPIHTSVALKKRDFDECKIEEGLHIGIVVKDFRAIVAHAETLNASVNARYSRGNRPMQITYTVGGILSEFTLMTRGSNTMPPGAASSTPARNLSVRPGLQGQQTIRSVATNVTNETVAAPSDARPSVSRQVSELPSRAPPSREPTLAPSASINENSLFIPEDDDQQWDEPNYDDEPFVTWDNTAVNPEATASVRRLRDSEPTLRADTQVRRITDVQEIAPTQRLSQIQGGLFD